MPDYMRCDRCYARVKTNEPSIGNILVTEVLRLKGNDGEPNIDIGEVIRCPSPGCSRPPVVRLSKAGLGLGPIAGQCLCPGQAVPGRAYVPPP